MQETAAGSSRQETTLQGTNRLRRAPNVQTDSGHWQPSRWPDGTRSGLYTVCVRGPLRRTWLHCGWPTLPTVTGQAGNTTYDRWAKGGY